MKTKLTLLTLLLTIAVGLWAENATPRLVVWHKNGEKTYFELNEMPETTFKGGLLVIRSGDYPHRRLVKTAMSGGNRCRALFIPRLRDGCRGG